MEVILNRETYNCFIQPADAKRLKEQGLLETTVAGLPHQTFRLKGLPEDQTRSRILLEPNGDRRQAQVVETYLSSSAIQQLEKEKEYYFRDGGETVFINL